MSTQIICLARSGKRGKYCVAGKKYINNTIGGWIRPTGSRPEGELLSNEIRLDTGNQVALLDVVDLPLLRHDPQSFQTENYLIQPGSVWRKNSTFPKSRLDELCDQPITLWVNGYQASDRLNDRVPEEDASTLGNSLYFIKVDAMTIQVVLSFGRKRILGEFSYSGVKYRLSITDLRIRNTYLQNNCGDYSLNQGDKYLCISLGLPYDGFAYKLIATVIEP